MQRYLETRTPAATSPTASSDLARHLLTRQHLGKTVVVCDKPLITMSVVRKYWLKLSRALQKERASTLNAEKILQLTYDITHMQHMEFAARPYHDNPHADVFFITSPQLEHLPPNCFSLYVVTSLAEEQLRDAVIQLPEYALVIDYSHEQVMNSAPLLPKFQLEQLLPAAWQTVEQFFEEHHIDLHQLANNKHGAEYINEVIDVILNTSNQFMRVAEDFLRLLQLAQPLNVTSREQQLYDLLAMLNRRIFALTPGNLSQQFTQALDGNDLSMRDGATENLLLAMAV